MADRLDITGHVSGYTVILATVADNNFRHTPLFLRQRSTHYLVCYPFRAPECIKLNAAIFRFTLVLSDLNVFT